MWRALTKLMGTLSSTLISALVSGTGLFRSRGPNRNGKQLSGVLTLGVL